ncbi:hypothetical protein [Pontibaca salina]|nr:hypothetical protein [Pontibaca salina]
MQILRFLVRFLMEVMHLAIKDALQMKSLSFDALKQLQLWRGDN